MADLGYFQLILRRSVAQVKSYLPRARVMMEGLAIEHFVIHKRGELMPRRRPHLYSKRKGGPAVFIPTQEEERLHDRSVHG